LNEIKVSKQQVTLTKRQYVVMHAHLLLGCILEGLPVRKRDVSFLFLSFSLPLTISLLFYLLLCYISLSLTLFLHSLLFTNSSCPTIAYPLFVYLLFSYLSFQCWLLISSLYSSFSSIFLVNVIFVLSWFFVPSLFFSNPTNWLPANAFHQMLVLSTQSLIHLFPFYLSESRLCWFFKNYQFFDSVSFYLSYIKSTH
jgi:hypothetical protein